MPLYKVHIFKLVSREVVVIGGSVVCKWHGDFDLQIYVTYSILSSMALTLYECVMLKTHSRYCTKVVSWMRMFLHK